MQLLFVENDHMIQTFTTKRADDTFGDYCTFVKTLTLSGITVLETNTIQFSMSPIPFKIVVTQTLFAFMSIFAQDGDINKRVFMHIFSQTGPEKMFIDRSR